MASDDKVRLYAERETDSDELMPYYLRHVSAMTTEALHAKSAIAAELAFRDATIDHLTAEVSRLEGERDAANRLAGEQLQAAEAAKAHCIRTQAERLQDIARAEAAEANARRYLWLRDKVCATAVGFSFVSLPALPANWREGSIAQHFDAAIDTARGR